MLAASHKPGAIPIRPLALGDIFDGAFKVIRQSPGATVGSAVLVTAIAMGIPVLLTGVLTTLFDVSLNSLNVDTANSNASLTNLTLLGGAILQGLGLIFVTGMIAQVTAAAALGRRLTLGQAWLATAGKRWKLVGLALVLALGTLLYLATCVSLVVLAASLLPNPADVLVAVLVGFLAFFGMIYLWARVYYLAVPPLMLEPVGVFGALRRSWTLTARQFWRTFGIALLMLLITRSPWSGQSWLTPPVRGRRVCFSPWSAPPWRWWSPQRSWRRSRALSPPSSTSTSGCAKRATTSSS
jgi:hypothetical protein